MRSLKPIFGAVYGTHLRRVARERLSAGTWDIDLILGSPGAVSTANVVVRAAGSGVNLLAYTSAIAPARSASQRLVLGVDTEIEFYAYNSVTDVGSAIVDDIRIYRAPLQLFANGIQVGLLSPVAPADLTVTLATGGGALIGLSPTGGQFFLATLYTPTSFEVVRCTGRTGDVLTVTRAQEGTAAQSFPIDALLTIAPTAVTMSSIQSGL